MKEDLYGTVSQTEKPPGLDASTSTDAKYQAKKDQGLSYDCPCYIYLESPRILLRSGRN